MHQSKRDRERIVFMGKRLTRAMQDWLQIRGHFLGEDCLFVTRNGSKLDERNIARILERWADKANQVDSFGLQSQK